MRWMFVWLVVGLAFAWSLPVVYQGKLTNVSGVGINDTCDIALTIYDAAIGGMPIAGDTVDSVIIFHGLFAETFDLNLSSPLPSEMWYEVALNPGTGWIILSPRQKVGYQIYSLEAGHSVYSDTALFAQNMNISLQRAYEGGETLLTASGKPVVIRDTVTGDGSSALRVTGNEPDYGTPTLYAYNSSASGIAIYCSGHFRIAGNKAMYSNSDWEFHLDQDTSTTDNSFAVKNDTDGVVLSVDETGLLRTNAIVATDSIQLGGIWRSNWPTGGVVPGDSNFIWNQDTVGQPAKFWVNQKGEFGTYMTATQNVVWTDNFEDGNITDWDTTQYLPTGAAWTITNPGGRTPRGGCSGTFLIVDDDWAGSGAQTIASAVSPVINLSPYAGNPIMLEFNHFYNNFSSDVCTLFALSSTGVWTPLRAYTVDDSSFQSIDISAYAIPNFQIKFTYYDPANQWAWYWMVDNIRIYYITYSTPAPSIVANGQTGNLELSTPAGDVVFNGTGLRTTGGAGVVGYNNSTSGLPSSNVQGAIDALDASLDTLGTPNNYIWNQVAAPQTANFWVNGLGRVEGDFTVGRPAGFNYAQVGPGTRSAQYPMDHLYNYSISQALYTSADFADAAFTATRIGWNKVSGNGWHFDSVWIYIKDTTLTQLTAYIDPSTGDAGPLMFLDSVVAPDTNRWFDVSLLTPFTHTSGRSVLVTVLKRDPYASGGPYYSHTLISNMHFAGSSDGGWPAPSSQSTRPDIRFGWFVPAGGGNLNVVNNVRIDGGLNDGASLGNSGQVLTADGSGNFAWQNLPTDMAFDTIQAVTDTLFVNDELKVIGDAYITGKLTVDGMIDPTGLALTPQRVIPPAMVTDSLRGLWIDTLNVLHYYNGTLDAVVARSPRTVITVASDSTGDFDNIPDAVAYAHSLGPGPDNPIGIDVMPGIYDHTPGTEITLPSYVQLRGKCSQTVIIMNLIINMSSYTQINNFTFIDVTININNTQYVTIYQTIYKQNSYINIDNNSVNIYITNNYYYIDDFTLMYSINIHNSTTINVTNNYYIDNSTTNHYAIHIDNSAVNITNNTFINFWQSIFVSNITFPDLNLNVLTNIFRNCNYGVTVNGPTGADTTFRFISNSNIYENCDTSLHVKNKVLLLANNNDILGGQVGILVEDNQNTGANLLDNKIISCSKYGISCLNSRGIIKDNLVGNGGTGINLLDFSGSVENNAVSGNINGGVVISASGTSSNAIILNRNELTGNSTVDLDYTAYGAGNALAISFNAVDSITGTPGLATGSYNVNAAGLPIPLP